ncbi:MKRN2 opposite strand protein [Perognathus longimembris pacificus]|uniref:MKRN2 opposite strand protein n=1 Tax=Perognathus longimembris pacificus TaxID=214514 RepID=UPI00201A0988|nr:MKRN2 opposite strand protein [Perognathus longimembris pacificus]
MHRAPVGRPLIKFDHCEASIYSFAVPARCPLCQQGVGPATLEEAPVSISSPLADGHREKCAFLLRPTQGSFLREYDGRSDLHVGITSTEGVVYHYTALGVRRDPAGWEQSLSVPLLQPGLFALMDQWDKYLEDFSATGAWLPHRYEEDGHNCYSYALAFVNCVLSTEGRAPLGRREFTEKYVLPRTRRASKYIALHRAVEERGFHAVGRPRPEPRGS